MDLDLQVRLETFRWLAELRARHGEVLARDLLVSGFEFRGTRIPLMSPQGIFKPRILPYPLTITTAPEGPYDDSATEDGVLYYKYRGKDPNHRDNVGLRRLLELNRPLVYFYGLVKSQYLALWPVYVTHDNPAALTFTVQVDALDTISESMLDEPAVAEAAEGRRTYVTSIVRRRLHQQSFRERVLQAYHDQCAFCRLRHRELLDAAHIVPDAEQGAADRRQWSGAVQTPPHRLRSLPSRREP